MSVTDAVDHLPLAVVQAGAYLADTGIGAVGHLRLLAEHVADILDVGVPAGYPVSLAAGLGMGFERLAADHPAGWMLLQLAAELAPAPLPSTLFTAGVDELPPALAVVTRNPIGFATLTGELRRRALARVGPDTMQLHRLVWALLRSTADTITADVDDPTATILRLLVRAMPGDPWNNPDAWPACRELLPHVLAVTAADSTHDAAAFSWLLGRAATYLQTRGEPRAALPLFGRAHQLIRDLHGENHPSTVAAVNNLASALRWTGEYQRARDLDEDAYVRCRRIFGDDHPDTLAVANNLAIDLRYAGEYHAARALSEDTLTRRRRILGDDDLSTLTSAGNFGEDLRRTGEHQAARDLDDDTLTRSRHVLGEDHPMTLVAAKNLAEDLRRAGEYQAARDLDDDTLTRRRRVLGEDHSATLNSANNLAEDLRSVGDYQAAHDLNQDTLTRRRQVLGEDHPDTLATADGLVEDLTNLGDHAAAAELREWITRQRGS